MQIEGMSIGDSLLNHFSEETINDHKKYYYKTKEFYQFGKKGGYEVYDMVQFTLKENDKKYIIYGITGKLFYENNFNGCIKKKDNIVKEIKDLLGNIATFNDIGIKSHTYDKSGKSKVHKVNFFINNGGGITIYCTDWSEEFEFVDNLKIQIVSKDLLKYYQG